jgi:hypothetical protein
MTIYFKQVVKQDGDKKLTVMMQTGADPDGLIAKAAVETLDKARRFLLTAQTIVTASEGLSARAMELANKYFLVSVFGAPRDWQDTLKTVITNTHAGLAKDVWIKTDELVKRTTEADKVLGRVNYKTDPKDKLLEARREKKREPSPYHTYADVTDWKHPYAGERRWGAIHIKSGLLGKDDGVLTFIHEATHKYASTYDYAYFRGDDKAKQDQWDVQMGNRFPYQFDDPGRAIWNADSYAWFICELNK